VGIITLLSSRLRKRCLNTIFELEMNNNVLAAISLREFRAPPGPLDGLMEGHSGAVEPSWQKSAYRPDCQCQKD